MFLTFSDSAKAAEAARSLLFGQGLTIHHSFFSHADLASYVPGQAWPANLLPLSPIIMSVFFKFFPATDSTVALSGFIFYGISLLLTLLITRKLHSVRAGIFATLLFASSLYFFEYAQNASTEIFFTTEILLFVYLSLLKNKFRWLMIFPLLLMFLTRQQAILFLLALPIYFIGSGLKNWRFRFLAITITLFLFTGLFWVAKRDVSSIYSPLKPFYSIQTAAGVNQGKYLRGQTYSPETTPPKSYLVKILYNSYNFAKDPNRLAPSAIFFLFLFSFFIAKNRQFTYFTAIVLSLFVLGASASIPNARYVHPIIPLVIISASLTLVSVLEKFSPRHSNFKLAIILFFLALPTLGYFTLDARFRHQQFNFSKPPVYREISRVMAENIPKGKLIITNLDAWAAWYEGLTTMWFPLSPNQLAGYEAKVDYIVITNYKENDADFALGEWREVVYSPQKIENKILKTNYRVLKTFTIPPKEIYENQLYQGTILIHR